MSDNLTVFNKNYTGVTGIKAKGTGNGTLTYIRPSGTKSISANGTGIDVTEYASVDVAVAGGAFVVTLSYDSTLDKWVPDCTYAEAYAAYQAGRTVAFETNVDANGVLPSCFGAYDVSLGLFSFGIYESIFDQSSDIMGYKERLYIWSSTDFTESTPTNLWFTWAATANPSDVASGKVFYNVNGQQTGTATPATPTLQAKTATPTESQQTVTADSGYDGLSSVTVGAISSTYVGSGITRRNSEDITNEDNLVFTIPAGYYSEDASCWPSDAVLSWNEPHVDSYNNITTEIRATTPGYISGIKYDTFTLPNYVGNNITRRSSTDLTASGATVTVPAGYYASQASKAVANGTAGTPTATKGTVSNHSVSVTPSVTNTTGYITGDTKTGTAVSVSASELVSGTYTVSASGTHDVTNYASASVAAGGATASATKGSVSNHSVTITPSVTRTAGYVTAGSANGTTVTVSASELVSGTYTVSASGTHDVTNYASASVAAGGATASASKGTVSNHSITVTPSVTRTAGYITAGSANGTAVTVSASELVSGSETKTANGTYDVTNLASLVVSIPIITYHTSSSAPTSSQGSNGDLWLVTA